MDRKQAQDHIGKLIIIDEKHEGSYIGVLNDVIAPPRKIWHGEITIFAVANLPDFQMDGEQFVFAPLKYIENEVIECIGSKLHPLEQQENYEMITYDESILLAAKKRLLEVDEQNEQLTLEKEAILHYVEKLGIHTNELQQEGISEKQPELINYTFYEYKGRFILVDERKEQLDLEDCPFEFNWTASNKKMIGYYEGNGVFISKDGQRYSPKDGAIIQISQKQFDPYFIMQNELEPEALRSFEHNLNSFGLTHEHIASCENTLLLQFIQANGETAFRGVNFLTYRKEQLFVAVQHHYERKLRETENDEIYDRFEFTASDGKRTIATYTNDYSN